MQRQRLIIVLATAAAAWLAMPVAAHDDPAHAIERLSDEIAREPDAAALYLRRADLQRLRRKFDAARADLARAARLDPTLHATTDLLAARISLDEEQPDAALRLADHVLAHEAQLGAAHVVRARALRALDRPAEAVAAWDAALTHVRRPRPEHYLERAAAQAAAGDPAAAVAGLDEAIAGLGPAITLRLAAINYERRLGRYDAALARVASIRLAARRPERWLALEAEILDQAGRCDDAAAKRHAARQAILDLPGRHRETPAMVELLAEIEGALER